MLTFMKMEKKNKSLHKKMSGMLIVSCKDVALSDDKLLGADLV